MGFLKDITNWPRAFLACCYLFHGEVCFFQKLERPKLLFPACSLHVLQGLYLPWQYVGSWIGQDHYDYRSSSVD